MAKITKKQKEARAKVDPKNIYTLQEASALVKEITNTKFDASVDLAIRLGVDPKKANQMVRGVVTLPHGPGKDVRVLALVTPDKEAEAKEAGADHIGLDEYLQKIDFNNTYSNLNHNSIFTYYTKNNNIFPVTLDRSLNFVQGKNSDSTILFSIDGSLNIRDEGYLLNIKENQIIINAKDNACLLYTSPSPRD